MSRIRIICPTRGRPERCRTMLESFFATRSSEEETKIFCYVADDDPEIEAYKLLFETLAIDHEFGPWKSLVDVINDAAGLFCMASDSADFVGEVNDDHVYRTIGWDLKLAEAIEKSGRGGLAYGKTENLPSAALISASCVRKLGWYHVPGFKHQFVDNALHDLYAGAGRLHYVPEVWIEHCHVDYGKAPMDATYGIMRDTWNQGQARYSEWSQFEKQRDIERLKACE